MSSIVTTFPRVVDDRVLAIVKKMATARPECDDRGHACHYCNGQELLQSDTRRQFDEILHEATCPIIAARHILIEWGMPVRLYKVSYQCAYGVFKFNGKKSWTCTCVTIATSEQEAENEYRGPDTTDIRVEYVCDLPIEYQKESTI